MLNFGNPLKDRVPGQSFSYSDHNAVCLEVKLTNKDSDDYSKEISGTYSDELLLYNVKEAIEVCEEAQEAVARAKKLFLVSGGLLLMLLLGTVGLWPHRILHDLTRILVSALSFYYIIMGTIWNRIEMNSIKAGLSSMRKYVVVIKNRLQSNHDSD